MDTAKPNNVRDVQSILDELFTLRVALASLAQERDAAILRQLPPEFQEPVANTMQEFADLQTGREAEEHALAEQIRSMVKVLGIAVQGTHLQASYTPGRRKYDLDGLDRLAERLPEVSALRSQSEPIISIRARAQRRQAAPLLYDAHGV